MIIREDLGWKAACRKSGAGSSNRTISWGSGEPTRQPQFTAQPTGTDVVGTGQVLFSWEAPVTSLILSKFQAFHYISFFFFKLLLRSVLSAPHRPVMCPSWHQGAAEGPSGT